MGGLGAVGEGEGCAAPLGAMDVMVRLEGDLQTLLDMGGVLGEPGLRKWLELVRQARQTEAARWYPEGRAHMRSGRSVRWLREQFPGWEAIGYAELRQGKRYYHLAVLPLTGREARLNVGLGNGTTAAEAAA